jgi:D-3-phosphoglycerate dehydrogenase
MVCAPPVASAALAFLLALAHKLPLKDRLTREGRWSEKAEHMGIGLRGRTLGLVGFGSIGGEISRLVSPHEMRVIAADPFAGAEAARQLGVELVSLDELLASADFVIVCCSLTPETRHLIGTEQLRRMKDSAYLINVARGPIVDQSALTSALREGVVAGAALDVFEQEPVEPDEPLLGFDNVIVAPHALSWTDESFRMMGESAFCGILEVSRGREPDHVVNPDVLVTERFQQRLAACAERRREGE